MPDGKDAKQRFYGISEEEIRQAQRKRQNQEGTEDYLNEFVRNLRGNEQDLTEIPTPRFNKLYKKLQTIGHTTKIMGALSMLLSVFFASLFEPLPDLIRKSRELREYEKLTEEEKREYAERQLYGGKTREECTIKEREYWLQKSQEDIDRGWEALDSGEYTREYIKRLCKNLAYSWAPTIFMLFLYLGYKKRAGKHEQNAEEAANFMLDWAEMGKDYHIDPEMLKNIMNDEFALDIIKYMAPAEAVWFEMLLDGNVEIAETPEFRNMATTIMARYLDRHPEAFPQVLEKYDRDAMPPELMPGHSFATLPMHGPKNRIR